MNEQTGIGFIFEAEGLDTPKLRLRFEEIQKNVRIMTDAAIDSLLSMFEETGDQKSEEQKIAYAHKIAAIIANDGFYDGKLCLKKLSLSLCNFARERFRGVKGLTPSKTDVISLNIFNEALSNYCNDIGIKIGELTNYTPLPKSVKIAPTFFSTQEEYITLLQLLDKHKAAVAEAEKAIANKKSKNGKISPEELKRQKEAEEARKARLEAEKAEEKRLQTEKNARAEEKRKQEIAKIIDRVFRLRADMKDLDAFSVEVYSQLNKDLLDRKIKFNSNDAKIEKYKKELKVAEKNLEEAMNEVCKQPRSIMTRLPNGKCARIEIYPAIG